MGARESRDCVVIGSGVDGLVAAAMLARRGRRPLVLAARAIPGGIHRSVEFHPGYRTAGLLDGSEGVRPAVLKEAGRGLPLRSRAAPLILPQSDGPTLAAGEPAPTVESRLDRRSPGDAVQFARWAGMLARIRPALASIMDRPATDLAAPGRGLISPLLSWGRLPGRARSDLLAAIPKSLRDLLDDWFELDQLKAALAAGALTGTPYGPRAAGTAFNLLVAHALSGPGIQGGTSALVRHLLGRSVDLGFRIRTGAPVRRIVIESGAVRGVLLESGEIIETPLVISAADPLSTVFGLIEPRNRPGEIADLAHLRCRGNLAVWHLALSGAPGFRRHRGRVFLRSLLPGTLDEMELAARQVKYGEVPSAPALHIRVPTAEEPALAPPNHHVMTVLASPVPYEPQGGWQARRAGFRQSLLDRMEDAMPGLADAIVADQLLLPPDIEREYGMEGGHVFHGDQTLAQSLFLRPHPLLCRGRTPWEGLHMAGPGVHPGGLLPGSPGRLAALAVRV